MDLIAILLIHAVLFKYVFPQVFPRSFSFTGGFFAAVVFALLFQIAGLALLFLLVAGSCVLFGTGGLLIGMMLVFFGAWLVYALLLKLCALVFSKRVRVSWLTAILVGIVLSLVELGINHISGDYNVNVDQQSTSVYGGSAAGTSI